jgi:hypothetical protein
MKKKFNVLGAPFCQNIARKSIKKTSSLVHQASNKNKKNKIVAHPPGHGNAHFGPAQQPTNNPVALI